MRSTRTTLTLLIGALLMAACEDSDERLREEVKAQVTANLAHRPDVPRADGEAAADALSEDVVQLRDEFEAAREDVVADHDRLERQLPSRAELKARDCAQQRLELAALQRLEADPESIEDERRQALPAEIRRLESVLAARCPEV